MEQSHSAFVPPDHGKAIPFIGTVKVSGAQSGDSFELIEYAGPATPPPHIHRNRDEAFYILEGTFRFVLGDEDVEAAAGSVVHVRRGTRHGFSAGPGARALLVVVPAGLEGFFQELGDGLAAGRSGRDLREGLAAKYDSEPG